MSSCSHSVVGGYPTVSGLGSDLGIFHTFVAEEGVMTMQVVS